MFNTLLDIEWMRPWAFLLLLLYPAIIWYLHRRSQHKGDWHKAIDAHLLNYLLQGKTSQSSRYPLLVFSSVFLLCLVALAGPSWKKDSVPVFKTSDATILLLDLSFSMDAGDIKPSRLARAKHKLLDYLSHNDEGETALIVYAGDAFVISPLTNDKNTIANMIPSLSTGIMPIMGSQPHLAFEKATELLEQSGKNRGEIIWVTDGIHQKNATKIIQRLENSQITLSILAIGTETGAPIPLPNNNGFIKDHKGDIVMPKLNRPVLAKIQNQLGARLIDMTVDNSDILKIHQKTPSDIDKEEEQQQKFQVLSDKGYWLLWLCLPLLLLLFRKNAKIPGIYFFVIGSCFCLPEAQAGLWEDLWYNDNQKAQRAFNDKNFKKSSELFSHPKWKSTAQFKEGNYEDAAKNLQDLTDTTSLYNKGNALAKSGKLDEAIEAYNQVLKQNPTHPDALFNKELIENIKKNKEQQNQKQQDQKQQDQEQQDQEQQGQEQQGQEQQGQEQQGQEQQGQEQQGQEQQDQEQQGQEQQDQEQQGQEQQSQEQQGQEQQRQEQQRQEQQAQEQQAQEQQAQEQQAQEQLSKEAIEALQKQAEQEQKLKQWLRKIPDNPGGLLKEKMRREYQRRGRENRKIKEVW